MSESDVVQASAQPVSEASLTSDLLALGVRTGSVLLVHCSLSSLGWVSGGAQAALGALRSAVGSEGTLVMPSQSAGLSEPSLWGAPAVPETWWQVIRETMPAYDPKLTPSRGMGAVAELFRMSPGALRSSHPAHSFAAWGADAKRLVAEHDLEDGLGERTPLGALYELDASVLLLGVDYNACTTLHLAERCALGTEQSTVLAGAPLVIDGARRWVAFRQPDVSSDDFDAVGAAFEEAYSGEPTGPAGPNQAAVVGAVGQAPARLLKMRALVDFAVPWFRRHRLGCSPSS